MDGMAMAFQKNQARVVHPWPENLEGPMAYGSQFQERKFIQQMNLHTQLLQSQYKGELHGTWYGIVVKTPENIIVACYKL